MKTPQSNPSQQKIQCVILAGGLGTRMNQFTQSLPKALIPVNGVPFVDHQLKNLATHGIQDILISIGYRGEMIKDLVGSGARWGMNVSYVDEGTQLKGTGGALRLAYDQGKLRDQFFVIYGDSYLLVDYKAVWDAFLKCAKPALMTVLRNNGAWDRSNALFENESVTIYSKDKNHPLVKSFNFIDYGLSAFTSKIIRERIPSNTVFDLADLFQPLSLEGALAGFEVFDRFFEIGSPQGLQDLEERLR